jgi:endonuclease/exonuclease/phosphatase (EEP) superfamily protein YafD
MSKSSPLPSRRLAWTAITAAALALSGVAAAHLAPWPKLSAWADVLTPFTGHFIIGGIAALLALAIRRNAFAILASGIIIAVLGHAATALTQQAAAPAVSSSIGLRIYVLNTWDEHPDIAQLERALAAVDADILVLAETDPAKIAMLARLAARYPHQLSCARRPECAMSILSRLPIIAGSAERVSLTSPPTAWARVDASAHGIGPVTIIGTHVHRPTLDPVLHQRQMHALTGLVLQTPGPIILAGDFNTSPWSASFQALRQTARLTPHATLLPTWPMTPVALPQFAIDHVMVSADLGFASASIAPATGSDHAALVASITRRVPAATAKVSSNAAP